ncbi:MAG: MotA/TolQ/ExbB proton channel family protein [candidate division WOR-3 bacterium]|jgi:biopolymer transport protein ExbB|nr:MotA/TolQ/ExbB proton channel family protein [candidate division WOR-3 bacterium]MCR4423382.1 MotA/TolQ/ExbB proton channel family protein [candidate division WOR-3 bacterium]MDH7518721.1 MotA/TolQ/ExbB proton channel family protein [bacterium]
MIQEFKDGGGIMWFLLACAVLGIALTLERLFTIFIRMRVNVKKFSQQLIQTIDKNGIQAGVKLCDETPSPVAKVLKAALLKASEGKTVMEDAIVRAGATELAFLDRGMALLAGLTTVAPFFGFLGTVTGMISAFKAIAAVGEVDPTVVSSGIAEALITTKWGLIIAAPLSIVYILISGRINGYLRDMETAASELMDYLVTKSGVCKE